jgi:ketosteroid isomerase-like protein
MEIDEIMQIERECQRLVTLYCHYVDHGEAARIADLFAEDGVWESQEATMTGRDEIRKRFQYRQNQTERMSRHVCNNLLLNIINETEVTGTVYLTLYRHDGKEGRRFSRLDGPEMVGEYRDRFVKTLDGWRFSYRTIMIDFMKSRKDK